MSVVIPISVAFHCNVCKRTDTVSVPPSAFSKIANGECVQVAWPEATANEREPLISGMHGSCFDKYVERRVTR